MSLTVMIVVVAIVAVIVLGLSLYNGLVRARLQVREGWSAVEVQLQRRASLIPNLVETVKGYAAHERETLENVTRARAQLQNATTPGAAGEANNALTQALRSLFAVAEAYPDLKANENFRQLQSQLADTEDKIAYARNYYNSLVFQYNTRVSTIPSAIIAVSYGFHEAEFFAADEAAQQDVRVSFS
jgi:LemA protein